ncbi:uncharacterized protein [Diabrotica undecimpunctata]|uniref:uncharacterized protein n=1 Tax=Diabrotica undecimpunctata TaxID=50387 RepID=UPI003B632BB3
MRVCSLHFKATDFLQKERVKPRTLKCQSVPNQKLPLEVHNAEPGPSSRDIRIAAKQRMTTTVAPSLIACEDCEDKDDQEVAEIGLRNTVQNSTLSSKDAAVQVNTPKVLTFYEIVDNDIKLKNFTGVHNFSMFNCIVNMIENYIKDKRVHRLNIRQRIMLVLTKFKLNLIYATLGSLFGISADLTKTYIFELIPILSHNLRPLVFFPTKEEILINMPVCFADFQNVRLILDCTEIYVQTPKCLCCRIRFYSQYKSHLTIKFRTGVSPGGLITYVSKAYGGRTSEKVIFEESNVITLLDSGRDVVMLDKGFLIDDSCRLYNIQLIRPPFLKTKSQLTTEEAILNAKIASARVHIERVNERLKIFKVLSGKLSFAYVALVNDIFTII